MTLPICIPFRFRRNKVKSKPALSVTPNTNRISPDKSNFIFLPIDVFYEILSWLPPKAAIKFKCVCKEWHNMITHRSFTLYHFNHARFYYYIREPKPESVISNGKIVEEIFTAVRVFFGLAIEKGEISSRYRLRNLMTQETLHLPNPQPNSIFIFGNIDACGVNLVSVYKHWIASESANKFRYEFEYLDIDRDFKWKRILFSESDFPKRSQRLPCHFLLTNKVFYCARLTRLSIDVFTFDLKMERSFTSKVPNGLFLDPSKILTLNWNKLFAFAEIVEEKLNVVVLEDYKNSKWSEKIVVDLSYLNGYPPDRKKPVLEKFFDDMLYFRPEEEGDYFSYNTKSKEIILNRISAARRSTMVYPNLLALRRNVF